MRIDARSAEQVGRPTAIVGGVPLRLAAGYGSVWVTDVGNDLPGSPSRAASVLQVDAAAPARAEQAFGVVGRPSGLAIGPGALWVTDSTAGTLTRAALR